VILLYFIGIPIDSLNHHMRHPTLICRRNAAANLSRRDIYLQSSHLSARVHHFIFEIR